MSYWPTGACLCIVTEQGKAHTRAVQRAVKEEGLVFVEHKKAPESSLTWLRKKGAR